MGFPWAVILLRHCLLLQHRPIHMMQGDNLLHTTIFSIDSSEVCSFFNPSPYPSLQILVYYRVLSPTFCSQKYRMAFPVGKDIQSESSYNTQHSILSKLFLNFFGKGYFRTTLGSLFQCLVIHTVKKFFLIFR